MIWSLHNRVYENQFL